MASAANPSLLEFLHERPFVLVGVFAVFLAAAQVAIDWTTWFQLNVAIVYSLPLVVASASRSRRLLWSLATVLIGATFVVYSRQMDQPAFSLGDPFFIDRLLAGVTILVTAGLVHAWMLAREALESQGRSLSEKNELLQSANRELLLGREQIARQNEELERGRRDAQEASVRKTTMLASLSHDIRNALQGITSMAELVRRAAEGAQLAAKVPDLARRLQANALSLGELLAEVIDASTLESGRLVLNAREFSLDELLAEESHLLGPLAGAKKLSLVLEQSDAPIRLRTDRAKLSRIIGNLVNNAIKFTDAGAVTFGARMTPQRDVLISVRDTGRGIDSENLKRIFEEFAQVRDSARTSEAGWGLGLPICRRLTQLIGGNITAESRENEGSVFTVRLPASCVVEEPKSPLPGTATLDSARNLS